MMNDSSPALIEQAQETAEVLKLLAHPQRLQLLCFLASGEKTVGQIAEICEKSSQSQISQFLSRMKSEGIVVDQRSGKFVYYSICDDKIFKLIQALHKIFCAPPQKQTHPQRRKI